MAEVPSATVLAGRTIPRCAAASFLTIPPDRAGNTPGSGPAEASLADRAVTQLDLDRDMPERARMPVLNREDRRLAALPLIVDRLAQEAAPGHVAQRSAVAVGHRQRLVIEGIVGLVPDLNRVARAAGGDRGLVVLFADEADGIGGSHDPGSIASYASRRPPLLTTGLSTFGNGALGPRLRPLRTDMWAKKPLFLGGMIDDDCLA